MRNVKFILSFDCDLFIISDTIFNNTNNNDLLKTINKIYVYVLLMKSRIVSPFIKLRMFRTINSVSITKHAIKIEENNENRTLCLYNTFAKTK